MEALQNKKLYPLYFLIALALMPATFLFCLHKFFEINDFETLINFAWLIVQNVGEKPLKPLVYLAFAMSFSPPLFMFYLLKDKKQRDSHGKARWANSHDIQKTTFSLIKLLKDALELINPLNFTPKRYSKAFSKFLDFGLTTTTPMLETNFTRGGFLLGIYKDLWRKRKVYYDAPLSALIVAPPGAGKSAAVALPNLLTLPTSCVVLDIKGELCNMTAGYRQKVLKNEIYVFNPLGKDNNLQFNPFDKKIVSKMNFNEKKRLVDEIANTIFVDEQGHKTRIGYQRLRSFLHSMHSMTFAPKIKVIFLVLQMRLLKIISHLYKRIVLFMRDYGRLMKKQAKKRLLKMLIRKSFFTNNVLTKNI